MRNRRSRRIVGCQNKAGVYSFSALCTTQLSDERRGEVEREMLDQGGQRRD
jgi:hypothetical protein